MDTSFLFQLFCLVSCTPILAYCSQPTIRNPNDVDWISVTDSRGNHFPDFSFCGYHNSDIPLPTINQRDVNISLPRITSNDFSPMIQAAIDAVSASGGGVVQLPSGRINITAGIQLPSNIVLMGTGNRATTLALINQPSGPVFRLGTPNEAALALKAILKITNTHVPVGSRTIQVASTTGLRVGQDVYVSRTVTEPWVRYNGMSDLFRYGLRQQWIPTGKRIMSPNKIKAINGNTIMLKIPITDNLDARYMDPELRAYTLPEQNTEIGIQNLRIEVPNTCSGRQLFDSTCNNAAIEISPWTEDCWVSNLMLVGFNRFVDVKTHASRITIQDVVMDRNKDIFGVALPIDIFLQGHQVLIQDCHQIGISKARSFSVSTDSLTPGPNAILRYNTNSSIQTLAPHERWSWGLLIEQTTAPTIVENRGNKGTGQGWAMNAAVGWNLRTNVTFQTPPLGANWCVGCGMNQGPVGNATFIRSGSHIIISSLLALAANYAIDGVSLPNVKHSGDAPPLTVSPSYPPVLSSGSSELFNITLEAKNYQKRKAEALQSSLVTVFMDPFLPIYVRLGILPASQVQLNRDDVEEDLQNLGILFRSGPVIIGARGSDPVSSQDGKMRIQVVDDGNGPKGPLVPVHTMPTTTSGAEWQWVQPVMDEAEEEKNDDPLTSEVRYVHLGVTNPLKEGFDATVGADNEKAKEENFEVAVALDGYLLLRPNKKDK